MECLSLKKSMLWNLKRVFGTLLQLLLQLLPRLLNFFVSLLRSKPMKPIQKWSLVDGTLNLDFPNMKQEWLWIRIITLLLFAELYLYLNGFQPFPVFCRFFVK